MNLQKLSIRLLTLLALAGMFYLSACNQAEESIGQAITDEDIELATLEATIESNFEEVAIISDEAMDLTDPNGRQYASSTDMITSSCAVITHDTTNKTITIDFGTGCVGNDGKTRSGQIVINYTQRLYKIGASRTVTLVNYTVDSLAIAGTRTTTNVTANPGAPFSLNTQLNGGQITFPDGSVATRQFNRTRTWLRAPNPINDEFQVSGQVAGTRRNGNNYQVSTTNTLVFKRKCRLIGLHVPVEGTLLIQRSGHPNLVVDFGNGACNRLVTVSRNGNTRTIRLGNN